MKSKVIQPPQEKMWHVIDDKKMKYFLVNVMGKSSNKEKTIIECHNERIEVSPSELLPYQGEKSNKMEKLAHINEPEILDWMNRHVDDGEFWIKLNSKVILDLNKNTETMREEFIKFVFGRFILSGRIKQYLCISNDSSRFDKESCISQNIFKAIKRTTNLWPYSISLDQLSNLYSIFFKNIPMKFKIYVQKQQIIKMAILPYRCLGKELFGQEGEDSSITFRHRIFNILANSSKQIKRYYRIPQKYTSKTPQTQTGSTLVDYFLNISLKIAEINEIIHLFAIIMNINQIDWSRFKKQDKYVFKIREVSIVHTNLDFLLERQLLHLLEKCLNDFKDDQDRSVKNLKIKQTILMRLIWEQALLKLAQIFNDKLVNLSVNLQDYRQFIYIQFPPTQQHSQRSPQNYFINIINNHIRNIALKNPTEQNTYEFNLSRVYDNIKKDHEYDINKEILFEMEKSIGWQDEIKKSQFMEQFKQKKIKRMQFENKEEAKKGSKIQSLFLQLQDLRSENPSFYLNYIIQSEVNIKNNPSKDLIKQLMRCVESKKKRQNEAMQKLLEQQFTNIEDIVPAEQQNEDDELVELRLSTFEDRYKYCDLVKDGTREGKELAKELKIYFKGNPDDGKIKEVEGVQFTLLSVPMYQSLEEERQVHEEKINKIKKQFKKMKFRHQIFRNLKKLYGRIKLHRFVDQKIEPMKRDVIKTLRVNNAVSKLHEAFQRKLLQHENDSFIEIKKRAAIQKIYHVLKDKTPLKKIKKDFLDDTKERAKFCQRKKGLVKLEDEVDSINNRKKKETLNKLMVNYQINIIKPPNEKPNPYDNNVNNPILGNNPAPQQKSSPVPPVSTQPQPSDPSAPNNKTAPTNNTQNIPNSNLPPPPPPPPPPLPPAEKANSNSQQPNNSLNISPSSSNPPKQSNNVKSNPSNPQSNLPSTSQNPPQNQSNSLPPPLPPPAPAATQVKPKENQNPPISNPPKQPTSNQPQSNLGPSASNQPSTTNSATNPNQPAPNNTQIPTNQPNTPSVLTTAPPPPPPQASPPPPPPSSSASPPPPPPSGQPVTSGAPSSGQPPPPPKKEDKVYDSVVSNNSYRSQNQNMSLAGTSTNRGIQKSETIKTITKEELYNLKDNPKFTFESWYKQSVGFQKKKPKQPETTTTIKPLFNKPDAERPPNKQTSEQLNVDMLIKQKIVVNPFFPYITDHISAENEETLQKIMSHQDKIIKEPLIKIYPLKKYPQVPLDSFNNLLKIGHNKNTSKPMIELINSIVKPIRETYYAEKKNVSTVFEGEPTIIVDYSWDHNIIKDQIFMQFIKQIMMNQKQGSLLALAAALEVVTRYYYPSPQFLYAFLHFLKSLQSKNIQKLNDSFTNTLLFAQAYEKYKGNTVSILKDEISLREKDSYNRLEPRVSDINKLELENMYSISMRLLNEQKYEFKVRNQILGHFRRKILKEIGMLHYQDYFGLFFVHKQGGSPIMINENKKAIDFLNQQPQTPTENILYVKLKYYFPFNLKEVNKTRIMYLNSIFEQKVLPWKIQEYENVVALSMLFDEFQESRISTYLILSNQTSCENVDLSKIQAKYSELISKKGQKINELEYFKQVKESGFIAAKAYKAKDTTLESPVASISKIIIKPLQICFYENTEIKSSINIKRIKSHVFQKGEIQFQIEYLEEQSHLSIRTLTLRNIDRINELYIDISAYLGYLREK